jgi:hypothetical protein
MGSNVDPTKRLRDLGRAMAQGRAWVTLRRASPAAANDRELFGQTRWVTTQDTYVELCETKGDPAAQVLATWVARLLFLRVNAEAELFALGARETKVVRVTQPQAAELSIREAVHRLVAERHADVRHELVMALARSSGEAQARMREAWLRRGEIGKRLGLAHPDQLMCPLPAPADVTAHAWAVLGATDDLAKHALGRDGSLGEAIALSLGHEPPLPWPGRKATMAGVADALRGEAGWLDVPDLVFGNAPSAIAPASLVRAYARFGAHWADAAAPRSLAPPLAHAPSELPRRTLGALVASLLGEPRFLVRVLGMTRAEADRAKRVIHRTYLSALRLSAVRVLLRDPALNGDGRALAELSREHVGRALGISYPASLALVLPRLHETDPSRLVAFAEAARLATFLRDRYDEDWYANPRAVLELRDRLGRAPVLHASVDDAKAGLAAFVASSTETLS